MEPAKIDWKSLESVFVVDNVYENINAPQWIDFSAPDSLRHSLDHDDDSWFCRPDCKHPKTAEDFLKSTPPKLLRSVSVSKLIGLGDWSWRREMNLKRRGQGQNTSNKEEDENENPNYSPPNHQLLKTYKAGIKSSAEKGERQQEEDEYSEILLRSEEEKQQQPKLKSTQSAKDLFGGRNIFGKITEFCNELKKMASKSKEKENGGKEEEEEKSVERTPKAKGLNERENRKGNRVVLGERSDKDKERMPLLEVVSKQRYEPGLVEKSTNVCANVSSGTPPKHKPRKIKKADEAENIPVSLNIKEIKQKEEERLLTTPQGFSATRDPTTKTTPSKAPKSRLMEKEILQEAEQNRTLSEELGEKSPTKNASLIAGKEGRALDVFWFLKPCTL